MFKRMILSLIAGMAFAVALSAAPSAKAACDGWCAEKYLYGGSTYYYDGCTISYGSNDQVTGVTCYYA